MRRGAVVLGTLGALLLLGAKGGGCHGDREVEVTVVRGGAQCGGEGEGPSARRLASAGDLAAAFASELGGEAPALDFAKDAVVLVAAGRKPTAGFGVELAAPKAPAKGGVAALQIRLTRPDPAALVAQVVTSPCLVVRLPREGLTEIQIVDAERKVIASVGLR
jgi:hypothetical protein